MTSATPLPSETCSVDALHARLAGPAATRPVVVCASARQAQALQSAYAAARAAAGAAVWETPQILGFAAFVERLRAPAEDALPPLLGEAEARVLWRLCVDESREALLSAADAAQLAGEAWSLAHEYRLSLPFEARGLADVERFNGWAAAYARRLERLGALDPAQLEPALLGRLREGRLALPAAIVLAGFDEVTPRLADWLEALAARGVALSRLHEDAEPATPACRVALDGERELRAAALWARQRLRSDAAARVAVIVPDLGARRAAVQRVFDEILCPQLDAPDAHGVLRPYNLTLGTPLADTGLAQAALQLLQLAAGGLETAALGTLLCSPYWGDETERLQRAALDARLRGEGWLQLDLAALAVRAPPPLAAAWRALAAALPARRRTPSEWAEAFTAFLALARWPGTRAIDSEEFQQLARWRELLLEFARLDRVLARVPLSAAVAALRELAQQTLFQAQSAPARLQVLGQLEAQGLGFDALWVTGFDDERWPAASRPHPFVPHALQRRHGLPHASAARELAYAQAQLEGWRRRSAELVLSYARTVDGDERAPSPLLAPWLAQAEAAEAEALPEAWRAGAAAAHHEMLDDAQAPPPSLEGVLAGGTRLLGDQARCPFRGFALHRLAIRPLETPAYGPQAYDRGRLVHRVLETLWRGWRHQAGLLAQDAAAVEAQLAAAVDAALDELQREAPQRLAPVMRTLEAQRLRELVAAWLEVERQRPPFTVLAIENRAPDAPDEGGDPVTRFAGLPLRLRPDRIDLDGEGRRIVLDYKTGARRTPPWADGRPEDPQLLLYALAEPQVGALAYARLAAGDVGLQGIAADGGFAPGIAAYTDDKATRAAASWTALHGQWRGALETLAGEIARGWAAVQPKHPRQSCRDCGLHALCRIREQVSLDEGEEVAT